MKKALLPAAIAAAVAVTATSAQAATVEELEQRIIKLEKKEKRAKFRFRSLRDKIAESEDRFRVNGFLQAGLSTVDSDSGKGTITTQNFEGDIDDEVRAEAESLVGIQMAYRVNDKTEVVTQIVGRGGADFDAEVEWAYLKYNFTDELALRTGRLRTPFFALSEFLEVGYALPWVRGPLEVYGSSISSYTGADLIYDTRVGDFNLGFQVFYGSDDSTADEIGVQISKLGGARFKAGYQDFTFSIGYSRGRANISGFPSLIDSANAIVAGSADLRAGLVAANGALDGLLAPAFGSYQGDDVTPDDAKAEFASVAFGYNDGSWDIQAEAIRQDIDGAFQDEEAYYLSVGYNFGDFTPYAFYSALRTTDNDDRDDALDQLDGYNATLDQYVAVLTNGGTLPLDPTAAAGINSLREGVGALAAGVRNFSGKQKSTAIGLRWDFASNVALKFEYQRLFELENPPRFEGDESDDPGDNANLYTIAINAVF